MHSGVSPISPRVSYAYESLAVADELLALAELTVGLTSSVDVLAWGVGTLGPAEEEEDTGAPFFFLSRFMKTTAAKQRGAQVRGRGEGREAAAAGTERAAVMSAHRRRWRQRRRRR